MNKKIKLENLPIEIKEEIEALKNVCWTHSVEASLWFEKVLNYFLEKKILD